MKATKKKCGKKKIKIRKEGQKTEAISNNAV